jgi:hypothetical protein
MSEMGSPVDKSHIFGQTIAWDNIPMLLQIMAACIIPFVIIYSVITEKPTPMAPHLLEEQGEISEDPTGLDLVW